MKRFKAFILTLFIGFTASTTVQASGVGEALCTNANVFTKIMDQMCWSCMLPFRMSGIGPNAPEGAASSQLLCLCKKHCPPRPILPPSLLGPRVCSPLLDLDAPIASRRWLCLYKKGYLTHPTLPPSLLGAAHLL